MTPLRGELPLDWVRDRECGNGHRWTSAVVLSAYTTNLSGERREYCPRCGGLQAFAAVARRGGEDADR